jgi:hypothetical protein
LRLTICCSPPHDGVQYRAPKDAGPINTEFAVETPLLTLLKELSARPAVKGFQLQETLTTANGTTPS